MVSESETELCDREGETLWQITDELWFEGEKSAAEVLFAKVKQFIEELKVVSLVQEARDFVRESDFYPIPEKWEKFYGA